MAYSIFRVYRDIRFSKDPTPYKVRRNPLPAPWLHELTRQENSHGFQSLGRERGGRGRMPIIISRLLRTTALLVSHESPLHVICDE